MSAPAPAHRGMGGQLVLRPAVGLSELHSSLVARADGEAAFVERASRGNGRAVPDCRAARRHQVILVALRAPGVSRLRAANTPFSSARVREVGRGVTASPCQLRGDVGTLVGSRKNGTRGTASPAEWASRSRSCRWLRSCQCPANARPVYERLVDSWLVVDRRDPDLCPGRRATTVGRWMASE